LIYCVVPEALEAELLDKLTAHYADDPKVEVIVDRRRSERRGPGADSGDSRRELRDRRRRGIPGEFPRLVPDPE
jgi:hypothetical protein